MKKKILKSSLLALFFVVIIVYQANSQTYQLGHKQITFTDPARSNRSIPCEIYYPATTAGESTPFATGQFPVIVFGHGFIMADPALYEYLWQEFAQLGYIFVFPTTESTMIFPTPNHLNFGLDLKFLNTQVKSENSVSASFFYGKIAPKSMIMGHSMGGKCTYIASANNTDIDAVVSFGAAMSDPPLGSAVDAMGEYAPYVVVPTLVVDAEFDCVVAATDGHKYIYDTLTTYCKTYVNIKGGGHCYFASSDASNCETGEGSCSGSFTITRAQQNQTVLDLVVPYVNFMLKNNAAAGALFLNTLTTSTAITYARNCTTSGDNVNYLNNKEDFKFIPNPAKNYIEITTEQMELPAILTIYDISGREMMNKVIINKTENISIELIDAGSYFISISNNSVMKTQMLIKE